MIFVEYRTDLISIANRTRTVRGKMSRSKRHRDTAYFSLVSKSRLDHVKVKPPCCVTLTRIGAKLIDGHDNLKHAFKATVDGIAHFLGVKDNDPRVIWQYAQEQGVVGKIKDESIVQINIDNHVVLVYCCVCVREALTRHIKGKNEWFYGMPEGWLQTNSGILVCGPKCAIKANESHASP